jgi:hypothetical protein
MWDVRLAQVTAQPLSQGRVADSCRGEGEGEGGGGGGGCATRGSGRQTHSYGGVAGVGGAAAVSGGSGSRLDPATCGLHSRPLVAYRACLSAWVPLHIVVRPAAGAQRG